jgi:opacity protein-like surface antigen
MRWCVALLFLLAAATPAAAQSTYVGAALVGDIGRFSRVDYGDDTFRRYVGGDTSSDGEAIGFNVRLGRAITDRWGVELELARTGDFTSRTGFAIPALRPERLDLTIAPFDYETERSQTMVAALAFVRQELGERVEFSYFGGVSFNRVKAVQEFTGPRILIYPPIVIPDIETIFYNVGPSVGFESAFKFGAAAVTAGIRLQTADAPAGGGWLVRPNVGMRWTF